MRNQIGVFVIPKFRLDSASGGAENICRLVVIGLSRKYDIIVFHGESDINENLGIIKKHTEHITSINAFHLSENIRQRGEIAPAFCDVAYNMITKCDLLLSFERVVSNVDVNQVCVLGGISYQHCLDIAKSIIWNKMIVPSDFIRKKCLELSRRENDIKVISNGIITDVFYSISSERTYTALLPYRPDWGKGYLESIDFISLVNQLKEFGNYHILATKQRDNDFANISFYEDLDRYAGEKNVDLRYVDWQNEENINALYNKCDFVLALGRLEEGFGLTTIEAISAGRYVISRRIGATATLLPPNSGIIFTESVLDKSAVRKIMTDYLNGRKNGEVNRGITYIQTHYNLELMQSSYNEFISAFIN